MIAPLALQLALVSAGLLGLRHGIDHDHIAAISDIASAEACPRSAMRLGLFYAAGHAVTVAVLGISVIAFQRSLPAGLDDRLGQVVGATLLLFGIYVLAAAALRGPDEPARLRSRALLLLDAICWLEWRVRRAFGSQAARRRLGSEKITARSTTVLGIVHGIGAETPSQLLLFLLAANLGGVGKGLLGLAAFLAGLFVMNAVLCAAVAGLIGVSVHRPRQIRLVAHLSAAYSIGVGACFIALPLLH